MLMYLQYQQTQVPGHSRSSVEKCFLFHFISLKVTLPHPPPPPHPSFSECGCSLKVRHAGQIFLSGICDGQSETRRHLQNVGSCRCGSFSLLLPSTCLCAALTTPPVQCGVPLSVSLFTSFDFYTFSCTFVVIVNVLGFCHFTRYSWSFFFCGVKTTPIIF